MSRPPISDKSAAFPERDSSSSRENEDKTDEEE